ncbi:hypothetical protein RCG19_22830 [Neobacillus sp. OS1-2]|uniref:hypothetical protein n=1 Tax=Neobacillus sp. OS1-2 TaxID=3070680 RepID=UPI0027E142DE|nr:hypothetical protein [Neobacillus sp. OS1-2]WML39965.1 hypothetical protein RCG19_22830 [Neobacillus sp. OS1-2]
MFSFETDPMLVDDREDLIAVLRMRFGEISGDMIQHIYEIDDMNTLQRLILAAANAASWNVFLEELQSGEYSFKILGEEFNPLSEILKGRGGVDAV